MKITLPAGVPSWMQTIAREIERNFVSTNPQIPVRLPLFAVDESGVGAPSASKYPNGVILVALVGQPATLFISNGVKWVNPNTGQEL